MSEPHKKFIELAVEGKAGIDQIDDYVGAWHDKPGGESLFQYLGMEEAEYSCGSAIRTLSVNKRA